MRNKLTAFILLFFVSFLLTACTLQDLPLVGSLLSKRSPLSVPVTLTMWGMWESPEVMKQVIELYQSTHPNVTINYEDRSVIKPLVEYKDRVFSRLGSEDSPDIVRVHASWVPRILDKLSPMPSGLMSVSEYEEAFYPVVSQVAISNGKVYGMPAYYDGLALVYNKKHFEEIGQQGAPTAWEEFRRLALELTLRSGETDSGILRAGAAMGNATNIEHFSDILGLMWAQAGVSMPDQLDLEPAQHALIFYTNFVREDKVWSDSFPEAVTAFANDQVSMIFVPSWRILDIIAMAPNLDFGVAPVPQALSNQPAAWATFWMDVVSSTSANAKVAWDFLNFLSQEEQQLFLFNAASNYREFGTVYGRKSLSSELSLNDYLKPFVDTAPYAKTYEIAARSGNRRQVDALTTAVEAVLSGTSAEEALTAAKQQMAQ